MTRAFAPLQAVGPASGQPEPGEAFESREARRWSSVASVVAPAGHRCDNDWNHALEPAVTLSESALYEYDPGENGAVPGTGMAAAKAAAGMAAAKTWHHAPAVTYLQPAVT